MIGARCFVDALENAEGDMRGDGAEFVDGHIRVYCAARAGAGTTRNESDATAV